MAASGQWAETGQQSESQPVSTQDVPRQYNDSRHGSLVIELSPVHNTTQRVDAADARIEP